MAFSTDPDNDMDLEGPVEGLLIEEWGQSWLGLRSGVCKILVGRFRSMSFAFAYRHASRTNIFQANFKSSSTSAVFGDPKSAEFVAAAASADSLPRLHGLPEVIVTGVYWRVTHVQETLPV